VSDAREAAQPPVEVRNLRVTLTGSGVDVVDEVSFTIEAGQVLGLVGESGSGKTTVGTALLGHARPGARIERGSVRIGGVDVLRLTAPALRAVRGSQVCYVPQDPSTALNPALRIGRQLAEPLTVHQPELTAEQIDARVADVLAAVKLPADPRFLRRYPHQLSGGQQQRACLAMAFLPRPRAIVLDEPTTGLDVSTQAHVLDTVRDLCASTGVAALYVTHDLAVVANLADQVLVMYAGRVVESGPAAVVLHAPRHPYTAKLLASIPDIAERRELAPIVGSTPAPGQRPPGCTFEPRCELRTEQCQRTSPREVVLAGRHLVRCQHSELVLPAPTVRGAGLGSDPEAVGPALLSVRDVRCSYGVREVLHGVSLDVRGGECLALVGESGSGKTTLARSIAGLMPHQAGAIELAGRPLAQSARDRTATARRSLQFVFQNPYASLNPRKSVREILTLPVRHFFGVRGAAAAARVAAALDRVALPHRVLGRFPDQLSGGERQRVAIARALVCEPRLLICDEITSALDVSVQAAIVELLDRLRHEQQVSMVFITHNLALVRHIADRVAVLHDGIVVETGPTTSLLDRPTAAYTRQLIADTPSL
jgi:peptide/nickel transport system ATP-binding protein